MYKEYCHVYLLLCNLEMTGIMTALLIQLFMYLSISFLLF